MSYRKDGKDYYRVTGVIGVKECEATGYNIVHRVKKDLVANAIALPGSLGHWKIEKFLCEVKEYAPPDPITWGSGAEQIIQRWFESGVLQERLTMPSDDCFEGFMCFYNDHFHHTGTELIPSIDPILIERTMFVEDFMGTGMSVAGTADLIARVWLKGNISEDGYFHECNHGECTECTSQWVVTLMDWKYSIRKQSSHPIQLSTYHHMAKITGAFDIASENGSYPINAENWSVLLKKPNNAIGYTRNKYSVDLTDFLDALKIMKAPQFRTFNHRTRRFGLKGRCMFCQYQNHCPDRVNYSSDGVVHVTSEEK